MMTPHDPDPLAPAEYRDAYLEGWFDGYSDAPREPWLTPRGRGHAFLIGLAIGLLVAFLLASRVSAAPRGAHAIPAGAAVPAEETVEPDLGLRGAPPTFPPAVGAPMPVYGVASWYATDGLVAAAGPRLRTGAWRDSVVTVSAGGRSVAVRLVDWCACPQRLIDLSDDAFARLAPLSRGLAHVTVISAGPIPTPPATDR
jgi:hypothetical protein